jgi:hypothetical protein
LKSSQAPSIYKISYALWILSMQKS